MVKKRKKKQYIPCFVFTPETLTIVQAAVTLLEQPTEQANQQDAKVIFAATMMAQIQSKLKQMQTSLGQMLLTAFDNNEKVVLFHAMQLYMLGLQNVTPRTMRLCAQIAVFFTPDYLKAQPHQPGKGHTND